jgi:phosphoribosylaminoimidazolecarboxamide formyltransferase/IMP cyclohydrolase
MKRRALISVTDKSGIVELARALTQANVEIIATRGTVKELRSAGVEAIDIEALTGVGELAGGKVKTLHPSIFAGILFDRDSSTELDEMQSAGIAAIDFLVVNLYRFDEKRAESEIDIGGVALLRAGAKNHQHVTVLSHPSQYDEVIESLPLGLSAERRRELAGMAFATTMRNEMEISRHFALPLRYGENPHQEGSLIKSGQGVAGAQRLDGAGGKELSYNNYLDADAAWSAVSDHPTHAAAIIKHGNPCGIAIGAELRAAFRKALECDPVSSYGGVVGFNSTVDGRIAQDLSEIFLEVVVAPDFTEEAIDILSRKKDLRILQVDSPTNLGASTGHLISGGLLLQERDVILQDSMEWDLVSGDAADPNLLDDLKFAWRCTRAVKSNAIIIAKDGATVGIGMGQVSRVDSAKLAVSRAGVRCDGAVAASDGFFPFSDGAMELARAGVKAIVQPGGSRRDDEVIDAMATMGITMYFSGRRHFSH